MIPNKEATELLFSYGTLRKEEVQLATFGRKLDGIPDSLIGYRLTMIRIQNEHFVESSGTLIIATFNLLDVNQTSLRGPSSE